MRRVLGAALPALVLAGCAWFGTQPPNVAPLPRGEASLTPAQPPPVPDGQVVVDRVVAIVNQEVITLSELQEAIAFYLRDTRRQRPEEEAEAGALAEQVLQRLVDHRLQVQEARREKLEIQEEDLREAASQTIRRSGLSQSDFERELRSQGLSWEGFRRELRDQLLVQRIVRRRVGARVSITEKEVDEYVQANREKFEGVLTYRARHLAILAVPADREESWERARTRIGEVRRRIRDGEPFAEVSRRFSEDPTAEQGGDLGTLRRGELAPLFERAILALSVGEVSEPVRSPQGLHLFRLEAKEELEGETLTQARNQAREVLFRQKYQERLEAWLSDLRRRAIIVSKTEQKS